MFSDVTDIYIHLKLPAYKPYKNRTAFNSITNFRDKRKLFFRYPSFAQTQHLTSTINEQWNLTVLRGFCSICVLQDKCLPFGVSFLFFCSLGPFWHKKKSVRTFKLSDMLAGFCYFSFRFQPEYCNTNIE